MTMNEKPLPLQNLCVADFRDSCHTPESQKWKLRNLSTKVFRAEACARQIWVGSTQNFEDFPELQYDPRNQILEGKDAYKLLLQYILGIVRPRDYDPAAERRFFDGWSAINRTCPKYAQPYNAIVASLTADAELIKKNIFQNVQAERPWLIARDMANQQAGDTVLLIGELDPKGNGAASVLTQKMAATLNGKGIGAPESVFLSHPNAETAHQLNESVYKLYEDKDIMLFPETVDYRHGLPEMVETADQIYVTMSIAENKQAYAELMDCWKSRIRKDNVLIDLKNTANDVKNALGASLKNAGRMNMFFENNVEAERIDRLATNRQIMKNVGNAIEYCAQKRMNGQGTSIRTYDESIDYAPA